MEAQSSPTTIDSSSPFRSVKEAVAIFGERLRLPREPRSSTPTPPSVIPLEKDMIITPVQETHTTSSPQNPSLEITQKYSPNEQAIIMPSNTTPQPPQNIVHGNDLVMMLMVLKKLESEVQDTKKELNLLKERESETQVALASLNAELRHNNMSKIIAKAAEEDEDEAEKSRPSIEGGGGIIMEERSRGDHNNDNNNMIVKSMDASPTLAKILSISSDYEGYNFREGKRANKNKVMKKKPIVPLVTDFFPWKKRTSSPNHHLSASLFSTHIW